MEKEFTLTCPLPRLSTERIALAHGGGGRMTNRLIEELFLPEFSNPALESRHDGAVVTAGGAKLAFTTDGYVVRPLVFPGGDIGDLAVNGTVNDLAMCGARPLYISSALILEEGLEMETLRTVVASMRRAAGRAHVLLVTGDTKVVDRGKGDGIFVTTSGIGVIEHGLEIGPASVRPGDAVIVSGDLGRHGISVLCVREGLEFESPVQSDTAPLWDPVCALIEAGIAVHCLRDLTRGGLSSALNEIASAARVGMRVREADIPVGAAVRAACEVLGLDPYYVANEGRFAAFVPPEEAERALAILRRFESCVEAAVAGTVEDGPAGVVVLESRIGGNRVLDMLSGEQLPRIC